MKVLTDFGASSMISSKHCNTLYRNCSRCLLFVSCHIFSDKFIAILDFSFFSKTILGRSVHSFLAGVDRVDLGWSKQKNHSTHFFRAKQKKLLTVVSFAPVPRPLVSLVLLIISLAESRRTCLLCSFNMLWYA